MLSAEHRQIRFHLTCRIAQHIHAQRCLIFLQRINFADDAVLRQLHGLDNLRIIRYALNPGDIIITAELVARFHSLL